MGYKQNHPLWCCVLPLPFPVKKILTQSSTEKKTQSTTEFFLSPFILFLFKSPLYLNRLFNPDFIAFINTLQHVVPNLRNSKQCQALSKEPEYPTSPKPVEACMRFLSVPDCWQTGLHSPPFRTVGGTFGTLPVKMSRMPYRSSSSFPDKGEHEY
jgi:hypothetical protein